MGRQLPTLWDEIEMRTYLILDDDEKGRAKDLSEDRRAIISQASSKYNFFLPSAYSLRRQFIRGVARDQDRAFYSRSTCMGDEAQAKLHAEAFETLVKVWLQSQDIPFLSENELLDRGSPCTPDFLLLPRGGVRINGRRVRWIDCKTFYGSAALCSDVRLPVGRLLQQARRYNEAFCRPSSSSSPSSSSTAVVKASLTTTIETSSKLPAIDLRVGNNKSKSGGASGFSCDLAAELAKLSPPLRPLPLLLNAHPLDTSALYKEGKKANDPGSTAGKKAVKKPRRKTSFSPPLHPLQIATWVLYLLLDLHFFAFLLPLLQRILREKFDKGVTSTGVQVIVVLVYCLSSIGTVISAGLACSVDPADEALLVQSPSLEEGTTTTIPSPSTRSSRKRVDAMVSATVATAAAFICCICCYKKRKSSSSKSNTTSPQAPSSPAPVGLGLGSSSSSGHSNYSNSMSLSGAVDLSIKWLNTCIGSANYGYFLGVVFSVSVLTAEAIALSLTLMVISFAYPDRILYSYDSNAYGSNPDGPNSDQNAASSNANSNTYTSKFINRSNSNNSVGQPNLMSLASTLAAEQKVDLTDEEKRQNDEHEDRSGLPPSPRGLGLGLGKVADAPTTGKTRPTPQLTFRCLYSSEGEESLYQEYLLKHVACSRRRNSFCGSVATSSAPTKGAAQVKKRHIKRWLSAGAHSVDTKSEWGGLMRVSGKTTSCTDTQSPEK
eukprot:gene32430-42015_t